MARIIALAQRKGGCGKTTLAVSIAGEIARRGRNVALVDTDPQRSACDWAEPGNLIFPVLEIDPSTIPVADFAEAIMDLDFGHIVIDTAPGDRAVAAVVALANIVLLPCMPSGLDIAAAGKALEIVNAVRARRRDPLGVIIVPTRVDTRTLEGRQLIETLQDLGETVGPAIGNRSVYVRAFSRGQLVADSAPGGAADREIRALCDLVEKMLDS